MATVSQKKRHHWTPIAPEIDTDNNPEACLTWKWCIRCGALRLGGEFFFPGLKQTLVIQGTTDSMVCLVCHE